MQSQFLVKALIIALKKDERNGRFGAWRTLVPGQVRREK